ncbi:MAG: protein kinase [Thermoanaerobaculales bacterium]
MLKAGTRLGPYEILAALGAGGMGEVYRARDTRLGRDAAIKLLLGRHAEDPAMRERFEREARMISALSHPGICTLYDVGEHEGTHFLVMEYLKGETLAERFARGPLPVEQALKVAAEIATALAAAHGHGVVHRDLKPGNIMLTKSGPKLLDFGLAKLHAASHGAVEIGAAKTASAPLTEEGVLLGTLQYMAPEQLQGREADARSDIFALGCVLYEMLTGRKAFEAATQAALIAAILHESPVPLGSLQPSASPALARLLDACLAKDPDDRWQAARDLGTELTWMAEDLGAGRGAGSVPRRSRRAIAVVGAGIVAAAIAVSVSLALHQSQPPAELTRFAIGSPPGQGILPPIALAADARRVLFLAEEAEGKTAIWVRSFDQLDAQRLPGTGNARGMFWSPDGREIGFFSDGHLKRMSADGGPVQTICPSGGAFSGAWSPEDTILFTEEFGQPIVSVPARGGPPKPVTTLDTANGDAAHFHPAFLPDGRHFVFVARNLDPEKTSIMLASLGSRSARRLFHADSAAVFAEPGYLLFARDNALFAWRFDARELKLVGEPMPAFEGVRYATEDNLLSVSAARNRLVYDSWLGRRELVWVDRKGREMGTLGAVGGYEDVRISPDGRSVAVALRDPTHGQNEDVWVLDVDRGTATRITAERTDEFDPAWSPDGQSLIYVSDHVGFYDIYERPASGGSESTVLRSEQDKELPTITPDGSHMLISASEGGNYVRVLAPLSGSGKPVRLSDGPQFSEEHGALSPDGLWTAFDSTESGQREVFVQPIAGGAKRQVSVGGGLMPVWDRSASQLYYAASDGMLMSVAVHLSRDQAAIGEPQPLFLLRLGVSGEVEFPRHPFDVSPDGQRFLIIRRAPGAEADGAVVVTNWTAVLRRAP